MKHIIHTGMFDIAPDIIGRINKITEIDNPPGLIVDATMDTEKLDKFKEDLDAWIRSERSERSESDETPQGLKMKVEILDTSNPYRSQSNYETLLKIKDFCEEHCVLDIKFFEQSETSTYVIVVYKD